jgi:hypothetical protein
MLRRTLSSQFSRFVAVSAVAVSFVVTKEHLRVITIQNY